MRVNARKAIAAFEVGKSLSPSVSISSRGDSIYSYGTCIAARLGAGLDSMIVFNVTNYSRTTSGQQAAIRQSFPLSHLIEVDNMPRGTTSGDLVYAALRHNETYFICCNAPTDMGHMDGCIHSADRNS